MIADFHIFCRHTLQKIATGDMKLTCLSKFVYRHYVEKLVIISVTFTATLIRSKREKC